MWASMARQRGSEQKQTHKEGKAFQDHISLASFYVYLVTSVVPVVGSQKRMGAHGGAATLRVSYEGSEIKQKWVS